MVTLTPTGILEITLTDHLMEVRLWFGWWEDCGESKGECEASVWRGRGWVRGRPPSPTEWRCGDHWLHCGVQQLVYSRHNGGRPHQPIIITLTRSSSGHCRTLLLLHFSRFWGTFAFSEGVSFIDVILEEVSLSVASGQCTLLVLPPIAMQSRVPVYSGHSPLRLYLIISWPAPAPGPAWWRPFIATSANYPTKETNGIKNVCLCIPSGNQIVLIMMCLEQNTLFFSP